MQHQLDYDLRQTLSDDDWTLYQRLTVIANDPPMSELRKTRRAYVTGFVFAAVLLILTGIAMATSDTGGANAVPWMVAATAVFFVTLLVGACLATSESRAIRRSALAGREALAASVGAPSAGGSSSRHVAPRYSVTDGAYDPALYSARGGRATARFLDSQGYPDWETYEANKPD
ncbi:MAG: hypothetical protein IJG47_08235 [Microbacterium sp.]|nr:hypothetical protein [Microbacterium sp.]